MTLGPLDPWTPATLGLSDPWILGRLGRLGRRGMCLQIGPSNNKITYNTAAPFGWLFQDIYSYRVDPTRERLVRKGHYRKPDLTSGKQMRRQQTGANTNDPVCMSLADLTKRTTNATPTYPRCGHTQPRRHIFLTAGTIAATIRTPRAGSTVDQQQKKKQPPTLTSGTLSPRRLRLASWPTQ